MSEPDHSDTPPPDDDNTVAGEYVLGVLDGSERRAVAQRIERDAGLARDVTFWEDKLGGLAGDVRPVQPPDAMWSRIETAIGAPSPAHSAAPAPQWIALWN